jgi:hypothetical protein
MQPSNGKRFGQDGHYFGITQLQRASIICRQKYQRWNCCKAVFNGRALGFLSELAEFETI